VAALNGVAYVAFAIARLPLLGRYLFVSAAMLALFAGLGVLGWTTLPREHRGRRPWTAVGLAALAAIVVFFPLQQVDRLNALKHDIANRARIQSDLHSLVEQPAAKTALARCARVYVESHRPVPLLALWAGRHPADILVGRHATCAVLPASPEVAKLAILDPNEPVAPGSIATPRARALARNRSWVLIGP